MKISCPACSAKYSIADDKVQDRLAKIRCRKCGATIVIDGKSQPPNVYTSTGEGTEASEPAEGSTGAEYSVDFGEGDQRTLPLREVVAAYNAGQITGDTYVWADGFPDWKALSEVPEIMSALSAGASAETGAPERAGAPEKATASPWDPKPTAGKVSTIPRAAARTSGSPRAASNDLFGRIDQAGSEEDVSTSAPEPSPLATPSASGAGVRNESSVLFSLSALTAQAQPRAAVSRPSSNGATSRDDSGLIDLKALTAAAMKTDQGGAQPAVASAVPLMAPIAPLGVPAPLGLPSPLGGLSSTPDLPQQKSKAPLFIGGGLAVGLIAIAAAIVLTRQPPPPPPIIVAAPQNTAAPAPAPAPTQEELAAKPPSTGTAEEPPPDATAAAKPRPRAAAPRKSGGGSGTTTQSNTTTESAAKPAAPAPKRNACGCASGDLQCAMKCAAKGG